MEKIIAFNWKMNPLSEREAEYLAKGIFGGALGQKKNSEIIIFPPFVYLEKLSGLNFNAVRHIVHFGAQNCFWENKGAYTGEISPKMLKNLGVEYVIAGHSERRQIIGETDEMINKKVSAALRAGLKVILCVGEPLAIRKKGEKAVENFIKNQLEKDTKGISKNHLKNLIIAYEPIWAIGTGNNCDPREAAEIIRFIKNIINSSVLYGGSVSGKNIKGFLQFKEINGFLVGGASLILKEIKNIIGSI